MFLVSRVAGSAFGQTRVAIRQPASDRRGGPPATGRKNTSGQEPAAAVSQSPDPADSTISNALSSRKYPNVSRMWAHSPVKASRPAEA